MKNRIAHIIGAGILLILSACKEKLDIDPQQAINSDELITDIASAKIAMNGLYSRLQDFYGSTSLIIVDLASDISDHIGPFPRWRDVDQNNTLPDGATADMWAEMYRTIYSANLIIQLLSEADDPSLEADKDRMIGEARFIRALNYFYLANLFGEVPLITKPLDKLEEVNVPKVPASEVFAAILQDLQAAESSVPASSDRKRVSKAAVNALLSKVYLTLQNWEMASAKATLAIEDAAGAYKLETNYADLFNLNISSEAILQLPFSATDQNVLAYHYWEKPGGRHEVAPSQEYVDSFSPDDLRAGASFGEANDGTGSFFTKKYKDFGTGSDHPYVLRLVDVILVKAEAEAELGKYDLASTLINQVRTRAGLPDVMLDASNYKDLILEERKLELAFEGGNRWLDMLRTGLAEQFVVAKGREACKALFPIPRSEIDANSAIVQNPCY
ncbi:MAG: RagB/SusD family nutrient uptake outer membrane protein [Lewinellaceae bacterium]|nr:RagB/SusD family nutrient uptake outer membrane protein [Saprospiraceae bacterium]MCB9339391.1 RagB/SusD family nutrient uptake outer membrane protein [Lewinellaceae bacterium]